MRAFMSLPPWFFFPFSFSPLLLLLITLHETKDFNLTGSTLTQNVIIIIKIIIITISIIVNMFITKTENILIFERLFSYFLGSSVLDMIGDSFPFLWLFTRLLRIFVRAFMSLTHCFFLCLFNLIIIIIIYSLEFFTSTLADGLSLEFEWQQVSSSLQDSPQYSSRSQ